MGMYYCPACQNLVDDDYSPMGENECCDSCEAKLEGWTITFNPKPIPDRSDDWDYVHEDFDGENGLCGTAKSREVAIQYIMEIEDEH